MTKLTNILQVMPGLKLNSAESNVTQCYSILCLMFLIWVLRFSNQVHQILVQKYRMRLRKNAKVMLIKIFRPINFIGIYVLLQSN